MCDQWVKNLPAVVIIIDIKGCTCGSRYTFLSAQVWDVHFGIWIVLWACIKLQIIELDELMVTLLSILGELFFEDYKHRKVNPLKLLLWWKYCHFQKHRVVMMRFFLTFTLNNLYLLFVLFNYLWCPQLVLFNCGKCFTSSSVLAASLVVARKEKWRRTAIWSRVDDFNALTRLNITSPIISLVIGSEKAALCASRW